eukprot:Sspe_Gene.98881::Locus_72277_Transcript_1_1_Confidence_1.000_Length_786::g.98881::m.98881
MDLLPALMLLSCRERGGRSEVVIEEMNERRMLRRKFEPGHLDALGSFYSRGSSSPLTTGDPSRVAEAHRLATLQEALGIAAAENAKLKKALQQLADGGSAEEAKQVGEPDSTRQTENRTPAEIAWESAQELHQLPWYIAEE